jgi:predicted transcriptional regulator
MAKSVKKRPAAHKPVDHELIARIEQFLADTGMNTSKFGRATSGESMLLDDLKKGRDLRHSTRKRILDFIAEYPRDQQAAQ